MYRRGHGRRKMDIPRLFRTSKEAALPPGTLVHVGEAPAGAAKIHALRYDREDCVERDLRDAADCFDLAGKSGVTWIDVCGIHDMELVTALGSLFRIHPLVLEDIVHTGQRPKFEDHDNYFFAVLTMLRYVRESDELLSEQVSIVAGEGFVITFQEREGDTFDPVRDRIRAAKGRIRRMGADYLAYALVDAVVDHYFFVLERFGEKIEEQEEAVLSDPGPRTLAAIHELKRGLIVVRRSAWPLRDALGQILRGDARLVTADTDIYFRDVQDHLLRIIDTVETFRDMLGGLMDIYLSSVSNRMNEIMKTLTIMATIFIPLTFVAGIYGMNFEYMPELKWRWGYGGALAVMAGIAAGLAVYFRKKRWL